MIKMIIYNCMVIGYKWLLKILEMGKTVGNVYVCVWHGNASISIISAKLWC